MWILNWTWRPTQTIWTQPWTRRLTRAMWILWLALFHSHLALNNSNSFLVCGHCMGLPCTHAGRPIHRNAAVVPSGTVFPSPFSAVSPTWHQMSCPIYSAGTPLAWPSCSIQKPHSFWAFKINWSFILLLRSCTSFCNAFITCTTSSFWPFVCNEKMIWVHKADKKC